MGNKPSHPEQKVIDKAHQNGTLIKIPIDHYGKFEEAMEQLQVQQRLRLRQSNNNHEETDDTAKAVLITGLYLYNFDFYKEKAERKRQKKRAYKKRKRKKARREINGDDDDDDSDSDDEEEESEIEQQQQAEEKTSWDSMILHERSLKRCFELLSYLKLETIFLDLSIKTPIVPRGLSSVLAQNKDTLKHLSVNGSLFHNGIEDLVEQPGGSIQSAMIDLPALTTLMALDASGPFLLEVIAKGNFPCLTKVTLNHVDEDEMEWVLHAMDALGSSKTITSLEFNTEMMLGDHGYRVLFHSINKNPYCSLQHLEINRPNLRCDWPIVCYQNFFDFLRHNKTVQELSIPVQWELMEEIFKALEDNQSIRDLYLVFQSRCNQETHQKPAIQALKRMLVANTTLENLRHLTHDGDPWQEADEDVNSFLRYNKAYRVYGLQGNGSAAATREQWVSAINHVKEYPEQTFRILSQNPTLFHTDFSSSSNESSDSNNLGHRKKRDSNKRKRHHNNIHNNGMKNDIHNHSGKANVIKEQKVKKKTERIPG